MMAAEQTPYIVRGSLRVNESMAKHTSWRVGGSADLFFVPADRDDLSQFLAELDPSTPLTWVGLGSNLLVRDGGLRGAVIATQKGLSGLRTTAAGGIYAEAGVTCAKLARYALQHDLRGGEFFAGIPGTFGGALAMNAGAFGGETWDVVSSVETIDRAGRIHSYLRTAVTVGYRYVERPADEWFVAGELQLQPGDGAAGQAQIKDLLARRAATQPIQTQNAGSVFRNPPNDHAARLIEACGLKGLREGAAQVSERHANFIINTGSATAAQIENLIARVQSEVESQTGVRLEAEVRIVGEAS